MVVANLSSIPIGSLTVAGGLFFLGRDEQGIYAMSMQCTHKGCVVALNGPQLFCSCHESRFDGNGAVLNGPATTPLPHYAVFVDAAGNISVDRFTVVSGDTRTPV
jgi:Rieske Fe-S protein